MLTLTKTFEFSASHCLHRDDLSAEENIKTFGKCANPNGHGHNYRLEVSVSGQIDDNVGMVIDAAELDRLVTELVIRDLDHKNLDKDVPWLKGKLSTIENVISAIWSRLEQPLATEKRQVRLQKLKLWETRRIYSELTR